MNEVARVYPGRDVAKPWDSELVFAELDDVYVGKIIRVNAGQSLSLQSHTSKTETICVISGIAEAEFGDDVGHLDRQALHPGEVVHLPAGTIHRITAREDLTLAEVSTAQPGWRTDVIRLEDKYGRSGTTTA